MAVDDRTDTPFGRRAVDWELKGVPVRVEIGPRDLEAGTAMLARRIPGGKEPVALDALAELLPKVLEEDQARLLQESRERRTSRTVDVATIAEAAEAAATGWARIPWADLGAEGEAKLAEQGVSVRCLVAEDGSVPDARGRPGHPGDRGARLLSVRRRPLTARPCTEYGIRPALGRVRGFSGLRRLPPHPPFVMPIIRN